MSGNKTNERTYSDDVGDTQHDHRLQVILTPPTILVVATLHHPGHFHLHPLQLGRQRLRDIDLYPHPLPERQSLGIRAKFTRALLTFLLPSSSSNHRRMDPRTIVPSHWEEHNSCETFIAAVFPDPLNPIDQARVWEICMNSLNNWTVFDYEEDLGRIALGSVFGKVTIVQL
ncbi:hypothetical protein ARMGADRAFT_1086819 [Armillaria gallica]|uniref:Uncharacterized protein n=1 Tax=Armillaria gallica TaxID=47427 RepID=A0A2H3CSN5_ARMGA|nr:hypothetical protein ARMGADRAFT_1086819 [Armillaria gallica]